MPEIAPDTIRNATLTRRLRGYDREETDELLAKVAKSYGDVCAERDRLSEEVLGLTAERREREAAVRAELERLSEQLRKRDRRITDLEAEISRFEEDQAKNLKDLDLVREELANVRRVEEELQTEAREHVEHVASRFVLREKALVAQITMLASQLEEQDTMQSISRDPQKLPEGADRAAAALLRLDRIVETLERESRREAELTLKKARDHADEIVHSAELRKRSLEAGSAHPSAEEEAEGEEAEEYDPVAAHTRTESPVLPEPELSDDSDQDIGEALWTSRAALDEPEPSR
jgi:DivIVA domain-containing protein